MLRQSLQILAHNPGGGHLWTLLLPLLLLVVCLKFLASRRWLLAGVFFALTAVAALTVTLNLFHDLELM